MNINSILLTSVNSDARQRLSDVADIFDQRADFSTSSVEDKRISLAEGGCFLPPHISVQIAMQEALMLQNLHPFQVYPYKNVNDDFLEAIRNYFENECGISYDKNIGTVIGFGSSHIFDGLLSIICEKEDIILAPTSYYHSYADWPTKWGGVMEAINTKPENGYKLQAEELSAWLAQNKEKHSNVKCLVLTNPTTTGAIYTYDELEKLSSVVKENNLLVFSDEVFKGSEFKSKESISIASLPGMNQYVLTANSGSKTRGVADLRLGWACGPEKITSLIADYMERNVTEIPLYLQHIGISILKTPQDYMDEAREEYQARANLIRSLIEKTNENLNQALSTKGIEFIKTTYFPESGHYYCINMDTLKGFYTSSGKQLKTAADVTRFFYDPSENNDSSQGVILSSGHSKGHLDLSAYLAFAQPGFEKAINLMKEFTHHYLLQNYLKFLSQNNTVNDLENKYLRSSIDYPDLTEAIEIGHEYLRESFRRIEWAIINKLTPSQEFIDNHDLDKNETKIAA